MELVEFSPLYKGDRFCYFPYSFLHTKASLKGYYSKRKEFSPLKRFFSLTKPLLKRKQKHFDRVVTPESEESVH